MNTAGRRRAQYIGGYRNLRPQQRPHFPHISEEKSLNRERRKVLTAQRIKNAKKA